MFEHLLFEMELNKEHKQIGMLVLISLFFFKGVYSWFIYIKC